MRSDIFSKDWRIEKPQEGPRHKGMIVKARREVDLADHLMYVTMPLTDDMKFILAVSEHLFNATSISVEAILEQKRYYKKLEAFPRTFGAMVDIWIRELQQNQAFERKHSDFLKRIGELKQAIATSSMRFRKQDKYILTNDVYDLKVLDMDTIKKYLNVAKDFVDRSEELIHKEDDRQSTLRDEDERS
jgi:hypothetical protein